MASLDGAIAYLIKDIDVANQEQNASAALQALSAQNLRFARKSCQFIERPVLARMLACVFYLSRHDLVPIQDALTAFIAACLTLEHSESDCLHVLLTSLVDFPESVQMPENVDELNMLVPSLSSHIPLFIESFCHQTPVPDSVPGVTSSAQLQASTQHGSNSIEKSVEKPAVSTLLSIPATSSAASVSPSRSPEKNSSDSKSTDFDPLFDESRSSIPVEPKIKHANLKPAARPMQREIQQKVQILSAAEFAASTAVQPKTSQTKSVINAKSKSNSKEVIAAKVLSTSQDSAPSVIMDAIVIKSMPLEFPVHQSDMNVESAVAEVPMEMEEPIITYKPRAPIIAKRSALSVPNRSVIGVTAMTSSPSRSETSFAPVTAATSRIPIGRRPPSPDFAPPPDDEFEDDPNQYRIASSSAFRPPSPDGPPPDDVDEMGELTRIVEPTRRIRPPSPDSPPPPDDEFGY